MIKLIKRILDASEKYKGRIMLAFVFAFPLETQENEMV